MKNEKFLNLDMDLFYQQKMLMIDLAAKAREAGYKNLGGELDGVIGVFDAVQDAAEEKGVFKVPEHDSDICRFADDRYNDVLKKILEADGK